MAINKPKKIGYYTVRQIKVTWCCPVCETEHTEIVDSYTGGIQTEDGYLYFRNAHCSECDYTVNSDSADYPEADDYYEVDIDSDNYEDIMEEENAD